MTTACSDVLEVEDQEKNDGAQKEAVAEVARQTPS